jgi:hypothetical protein
MKRVTIAVFVTAALTILMTSSCRKDQLEPSEQTIVTGTSPGTLNLVADNWQGESNELYIDLFKNVISQVYINSGVKIYLLADGKEILMNNAISFMGGQLLASHTSTDIRIVFRPSPLHEKAFDYLDIKVVFF